MAQKLSDKLIKDAATPAAGQAPIFLWDDEVKGFGVRITPAGARSFILDYRTKGGRQRRMTIGSCDDWKVAGNKGAREKAKELKRAVDDGADPMQDRHDNRGAPTVQDLSQRFIDEHLSKRRASTNRDYTGLLNRHILPALGKTKVADVSHSDIEKLHSTVAKTAPYQANRAVAVLSKMFSLAIRWKMRTDNPCRGVERAPEEKRERFLSPAEITRLADALTAHSEKVSANAIRLLLLTGARRGEVLSMEWAQVDMAAGTWTKPSSHTKQKKEHRVPLSAPSLALLTEIRPAVDRDCPFVFPGDMVKNEAGKYEYRHLVEIKKSWVKVCIAAGLAKKVPVLENGRPVIDKDGQPVTAWENTVRLHDLRHSYASILASAGLSLPIIGALLGHTQTQTTARYTHLMDDALRAATERVGQVVTASKEVSAEVISIGRGR